MAGPSIDPVGASHARLPMGDGRFAAFSLIEVCLALGLVTFCLIALLGLFQAGMRQERLALDQARAAHVLGAIAGEFKGLARPPTGITNASGTSNRFGIQLPDAGGSIFTPSAPIALDERGERTTSPGDYLLYYQVIPPSIAEGAYVPHRVRILLAWPGSAEFTVSGTTLGILKARGNIETTLELNRG